MFKIPGRRLVDGLRPEPSAYLMIGQVVFTITAERPETLAFFSRSHVRFESTEFSAGPI